MGIGTQPSHDVDQIADRADGPVSTPGALREPANGEQPTWIAAPVVLGARPPLHLPSTSGTSATGGVTAPDLSGDQPVCDYLRRSHRPRDVGGSHPAETHQRGAVSDRTTLRRFGPYGELDFGSPDATTHLDRDQERRLRRIRNWLDENDNHFDWLGLYRDDMTAPTGNLSERIEWAKAHLPMWLDATLAPTPEEFKTLDSVYDEGAEWLKGHRQAPFVEVDAVIERCRTLGLDWLADDLAESKDTIEKLVTNGKRGDGHQKKASLRARSLNDLATSLEPRLNSVASTLSEYERLRTDIIDMLDQIDDWTDDSIKGRQGFIKRATELRKRWNTATLLLGRPKPTRPPKRNTSEPKPSPRATSPDRISDLTKVLDSAANATADLEKLQKETGALGAEVEDAHGSLPTRNATNAVKGPTHDVVMTASMKPKEAADLLPLRIANANSVASDIINNPTDGWTTFEVRGSTVYHSSAGSKSAGNQAGTAFWIVKGADRIVVAMGKHTGGKSDTYRIRWRATGVSGALVKLDPKTPADRLTG